MWQFVTVPADEPNGPAALRRLLPLPTTALRRVGVVTHGLTHRRYHFDVFACDARDGDPAQRVAPRVWTDLAGLAAYPLPRPHVKVLEMLRDHPHITA
jgi:hypothetical protein